jgi:hypothetical protein
MDNDTLIQYFCSLKWELYAHKSIALFAATLAETAAAK